MVYFMLEKEYNYFNIHRNEFIDKFKGKFIVIMNESVLGTYNTMEEAISVTTKTHKIGSFLIQECIPEEQNIQHFHTRVAV